MTLAVKYGIIYDVNTAYLTAGKEDVLKQSNNKKHRDTTAALYLRISREDKSCDESYSIINQKKLLTGIAKEMRFTKILLFIDDGITGTKKDRKEFMRMIAELEKGHIGVVMVKDLSRLGRDHIRMDQYIEEFFPEHDIRLIAVSEGLDTANGEDEFTPFRNLMNEWYARDISKKRKLTNLVKGNAGEPLSLPPYGYVKDPENSKRWIVDKEAADVVKRIFTMSLDGFGTEQIASTLQRDEILTPIHYWASKGINRGGTKNVERPNKWNSTTVIKILSTQEYCGDVINFKTYSKSFKLKRRILNSEENMAIFKDVHEPIIDRDVWNRIQEKRGKTRRRKTNAGEKNMFSGLLVCADCGHNLHYHFNQKNPDIKYFNCSNYKGNRGTCPTTHYIRVDFLEQVVLGEIRRLTKFAVQYEDEFVKVVAGHSRKTAESQLKQKLKDLNRAFARDKEVDQLFNRMYEDNIAGKIDDERFAKMSKQYGDEQGELSVKIKALQAEFEKQTDHSMTTEHFIDLVRKYIRVKKLTPRMLNELIDKIEVFHAQRIDGVNVQKLIIHYNCIGTIEIPDLKHIPEIDVLIPTRQGVATGYQPKEKVI